MESGTPAPFLWKSGEGEAVKRLSASMYRVGLAHPQSTLERAAKLGLVFTVSALNLEKDPIKTASVWEPESCFSFLTSTKEAASTPSAP